MRWPARPKCRKGTARNWHDPTAGGPHRPNEVTAGKPASHTLDTAADVHRQHVESGFRSRLFRARARESIERGLRALEAGDIPFGGWERLHLAAAIDEYRSGHFESALVAAERIVDRRLNRQPFRGRFSQEKGLEEYRAEFESLKKQP